MTCAASTVEAATTTADRASAVKAVAASAVKVVAASTMEAVPAVEFITSADSTTEPFVTMEPVVTAPVTIPTTAMIPIAATIIAAAVVAGTVEPMEPRAGPDEYSVREVVRTPISVRRASIRRIRVVTVSADRRTADHSNADSHSYLRARNSAHRKN